MCLAVCVYRRSIADSQPTERMKGDAVLASAQLSIRQKWFRPVIELIGQQVFQCPIKTQNLTSHPSRNFVSAGWNCCAVKWFRPAWPGIQSNHFGCYYSRLVPFVDSFTATEWNRMGISCDTKCERFRFQFNFRINWKPSNPRHRKEIFIRAEQLKSLMAFVHRSQSNVESSAARSSALIRLTNQHIFAFCFPLPRNASDWQLITENLYNLHVLVSSLSLSPSLAPIRITFICVEFSLPFYLKSKYFPFAVIMNNNVSLLHNLFSLILWS